MSHLTYLCLDCGERIEETASPIVIRLTVGTAEIPWKPVAEPRDLLLPLTAWKRLQREVPNESELCPACWSWWQKEPLLDYKGRVVVDPSKFVTKEEFEKAVDAELAARAAQ